jgi:cell wall-associated NlpC family hydrolase
MKRALMAVIVVPVLAVAGLGLAVIDGLVAVLDGQVPLGAGVAAGIGSVGGAAGGEVGRRGGLEDIPTAMLRLYATAAATCPGLPWTVLAAIGSVESDHGRSNLPGLHSGQNPAGAEGPMQFEPATFASYSTPVPPGGADPPSPYDPTDAVFAAARMLCADGGAQPDLLGQAVYDYNHSAAYVAEVLSRATAYGLAGSAPAAAWSGGNGAGAGHPAAVGAGPTGVGAGRTAVEYALAQVGTPYRWGEETAGVGFDCSGLAQAAWAAAGVGLPRVADTQYEAGPPVPIGQPLVPGDLVFFGPPGGPATHVGLVVDPGGVMVDAPHAGATVRVEAFPAFPGAAWGDDVYLGATDPGA